MKHFIKYASMNSTSRIILYLCLILCITIPSKLYSQQNNNSLETEYETLKQHMKNGELEMGFHLANELKTHAAAQSSPVYLAHSNYYLGIYYQNINKLDSSNIFFNQSVELYKKVKDTLRIGKTYFFIGINYTYVGQADTSLVYYSKGADYLSKTQDSVWNSVINNYICITHFEMGNYIQALKYSQISLDYLKKSDDFMSIGGNYNTMGNIYRKMKDPEKEKQAYLNAINFLEQIPLNHQLCMVYNNLAEVYLNEYHTELGFDFLEKAKSCYLEIDYQLGMCAYYSVLSLYYINLENPNYDKVIEYSSNSLRIAEEFSDYRQFSDASYFLGRALFHKKEYAKAEKTLLRGYQYAKDNYLANELKNITKILSQVYENQKNYSKSLVFIKEHNNLKDSLFNQEKIKEFTSLDLSYKFKQQQLNDSIKNAIDKTKTRIKHDAEIRTHSMIKNFSLVISILIIAFAIYLLFSVKKKKKLNDQLKIQNSTINIQKNEIEISAQKIQKALKELQELDDFKQTFISMLVHDLKNPLNALTNIEEFQDDETRIAIVKQTSHEMLHLVLNMLDISRADHQKFNLQKIDLSLIEVMNRAIDDTRFLSKQKNIKIKLGYNKNYFVLADYSMLLRVLINLLTNAIKFSNHEDYINIDIDESKNKQVLISIKDNGPGINIKDQEIIFEKYKQIKKENSGNIHSTGLGLAFCKLAIEAHGWDIGLNSAEGFGAEFWIKISDFTIRKNMSPPPIPKYKEISNNNLSISKEDFEKVVPYLYQLQKLQVYAVSDVKKIIEGIKHLGIKELQEWTEQILTSVQTYDENKYVFLVHSILK